MSEVKDRISLSQEFMFRATSAQLSVVVPSYGVYETELAVVGEAPGEQEVRQRMPFVGGSGQLLWQYMGKYHIKRHECYVTNVMKRQVSLSSTTDERKQVSKGEFDLWADLLRWELSQLPNLKYVLILGNMALKALTGLEGITQWRGSVFDGEIGKKKVKFIVTYNPAYVMREPKLEPMLPYDIQKLKMVRDGTYLVHEVKAHINPTVPEALEWIDKMKREGKPVSYDIETVNQETACWGLANDAHEGMCISLRSISENTYDVPDEIRLRHAMQELLGDEKVRIIAQNGAFDSSYTWYKDRIVPHKIWHDTLLAHHTLYPQLPHNLGFLVSQYTTHPFYKDEKDAWRQAGNIDDFWRYNVKDAALTYAVAMKEIEELEKQQLDKFFYEHVMRAQHHLVNATIQGIRFDVTHKAGLQIELENYVSKLKAEFREKVKIVTNNDPEFDAINPNSFPALKKLFFTKLRLIGKGTSTDDENRQRIMDHPMTKPEAKEMLVALGKYKKEDKFVSTYVDVNLDEDNRMRCEYKQFGTQKAPGRLSSSKTGWGTGMNLQNQPERAHSLFLADEGCCFVYYDLSQAEARVVAYEAEIDKWKEQFERARLDGSYDCHRALASDMWAIPYDQVPQKDRDDNLNPTLRYIAKRCRHGLNYRMMYPKLAEQTGLAMMAAKDAFDKYHRQTPELMLWWAKVEMEARKTKTLFNAMGRRWIILERITDETLESIVAFKPQSLIGDWNVKVWYQSEDDSRWPVYSRIGLNVHDALIAMVPLRYAKQCAAIMKEYAEQPMLIKGDRLIIPAEVAFSVPDEKGLHKWSSLKKVKDIGDATWIS